MYHFVSRFRGCNNNFVRTVNFIERKRFSCSRVIRDSLVIVEHDNATVASGTLNVISAAQAIGKPVDVLVLGHNSQQVVSTCSSIKGIRKILHAEHKAFEHPTAEPLTTVIVGQVKEKGYTHVLAPGSFFGKNFIPRVGAFLDVQPISEIQSVVSEDTFVRPIYAGNALQQVQSLDKIKLITVRTTSFSPATKDATTPVPVEKVQVNDVGSESTKWVSTSSRKSERPELATASIVVSGGRGLKNGENFSLLYALADQLNAAVGASRAAVDAGFVPNELQVGQTGKVVAPSLYIAAGISGAIQHLAGMKDSKVIVAINTDEEAPIFQVADYV
jgi:electron transfer flavoprotein alpha subunit